GDWVDALDELKINHDERRVVASAGAYALGRKTDELIIDAMKTATQAAGSGATGLTKELVLSAVGILNENDVPDDGRRFCVVGVNQWNQLLSMDEFVNADYTGAPGMVAGFEVRKWLGINWILHNGLPASENKRDCFMYHASAIGHACGQEVKTDISWVGERAAHFISNSMSQGAVLVDKTGIVRIACAE
ncbi:MAG: phage capsid protein, partial [Alphaproteobacteria bacterium]|nr:phage capsid protein [Alphaproteobacteria bacterium]